VLAFVVRRVASGVLVMWGIITLVFLIGYVMPINPARVIAGRNAPNWVVASIRRELGLDRPLPVQYGSYLWDVAHGNLGEDYATSQPVAQALAQRLPFTVELTAVSVFGELLIGVTLGIIAAAKRATAWDGLASVSATLGLTMPPFWLGLILLYVLAFRLPIFPLGSVSQPDWVVLPAFSLAFTGAGFYTRMGRSSVLASLGEDYVRTARAKGLDDVAILMRHVLRNALRPIVTMAGLDFATLMGGVLVTEQVFGIPGLGTLAWNAILANDLPILEGVVIVVGAFVVVSTIVVDIAYSALDPRVRLAAMQ
jgi:ABC-type dipeptide/oligopeptide/nickel transport system permease component